MTIIHLVGSLLVAGIQRFVVDLAREQVQTGHIVVVVALNGEPDACLARELSDAAVSVVCLHKSGNRDPRTLLRLISVLRRYDPDVLHTHGYPITYGLPAATALGVPVVHTLHALMDVEVSPGTERFYRAALRVGVRFVAISAAVARSFRERFNAEADVIDSGVNLAAFDVPVDRAAVRAHYNLPADGLLVATVARIEPVKGVDLALQVFADVAPKHPDVHWVVAGIGSELDALTADAAACAVSDRVHLLGLVADIPTLLGACDVFLLTSRSEGLGLSTIEALAAGLPCVVPPVGGLCEVVHNEHNGLVAEHTGIDSVGMALDAILSSSSLRKQLAREARASVQRFSVSGAATAYARAYIDPPKSRLRRWVRRL